MALADGIAVMGSPIDPKVRGAITTCDLSASLSSVAQLDIQFTDANWVLLQSGLFTLNQRVQVGSLKLEISAISTGDDNETENFSIKCRPLAFRLLKDRQGARVVRGVSPSEFVIMECNAVGISYVVQPSAKRSQVSRDVLPNGQKPDIANPPSSWTTFQRLARELGFYMFESLGTIYFGKPSWLLSSGGLTEVAVNHKNVANDDITRALQTPSCNRTLDDPAVTVSSSRLVDDIDDIQPGRKLVLSGVPTFDGNYLVSDMSVAMLDTPNIVDFTATTPVDPEPPKTSSSSGGGGITGPWYDESKL